jgi:hypothetical protein
MSSSLPKHGVYRKHEDEMGLNIEEDEMVADFLTKN